MNTPNFTCNVLEEISLQWFGVFLANSVKIDDDGQVVDFSNTLNPSKPPPPKKKKNIYDNFRFQNAICGDVIEVMTI